MQDAYISFHRDEAYIYNMHISPYQEASIFNEEPTRPRKLLLNRREIRKLQSDVQKAGYTIIPLKVYLNDRGLMKIEIATAKGKKLHDKRQDIAKRDAQREMSRAMKYNR
ncbi:SsrA-binding protein SmpB [Treponema phagedenis]|uniref:SsrA-binding protein SmpB n=1 Tax=Treponema phagedenis TaxID=162 RepID=UPI0025B18DBE|nr:SsrA-binding protein SmpB [Treponema phagedenis]